MELLAGSRLLSSFVMFEHRKAVFDGVEQHILDLQLVFVVCVCVAEMSELLRLEEAPLQVLRGDKVFGHFDAVVDVANLKQECK